MPTALFKREWHDLSGIQNWRSMLLFPLEMLSLMKISYHWFLKFCFFWGGGKIFAWFVFDIKKLLLISSSILLGLLILWYWFLPPWVSASIYLPPHCWMCTPLYAIFFSEMLWNSLLVIQMCSLTYSFNYFFLSIDSSAFHTSEWILVVR